MRLDNSILNDTGKVCVGVKVNFCQSIQFLYECSLIGQRMNYVRFSIFQWVKCFLQLLNVGRCNRAEQSFLNVAAQDN